MTTVRERFFFVFAPRIRCELYSCDIFQTISIHSEKYFVFDFHRPFVCWNILGEHVFFVIVVDT